jgi:hypothetical protein
MTHDFSSVAWKLELCFFFFFFFFLFWKCPQNKCGGKKLCWNIIRYFECKDEFDKCRVKPHGRGILKTSGLGWGGSSPHLACRFENVCKWWVLSIIKHKVKVFMNLNFSRSQWVRKGGLLCLFF